jgi:hypothetical protein
MRSARSLKVPSEKVVQAALDTLLEHPYALPSLSPQTTYHRRHDDTDGERGPEQDLAVHVAADNDAWVSAGGFPVLRFRDFFGGGLSPRTRAALLILAEAIRRDNEAHPQSSD